MTSGFTDYQGFVLKGDASKPLLSFKPRVRDVGEYTIKWFNDHRGQLPPITIIAPPKGSDINTVANAFFNPQDNNLVSIDHINWMMYEVIKDWEGELSAPWESYGRRLSGEGNKVKITGLFELKLQPSTEELPEWYKRCGTEFDAKGAIYSVFAPLRISSKYQDYNNAIAKRMKEITPANVKAKSWALTIPASKYATWVNNPTYKRLAAIIDMFLDRFPNHDHARLRMGTIVTRYKDSSLLNSIPYFHDILGVPGSVMVAWVWHRESASQMLKLLHSDNMISEEYGFSPYGCALDLISKSINSITQNASLHIYIHSVAALCGKTRSMNAHCPESQDHISVMKISLLVAGIKMICVDGDIVFGPAGEETSQLEEDDLEEDEENDQIDVFNPTSAFMRGRPTVLDPVQWSAYLKLHDKHGVRDHLMRRAAMSTAGWTSQRDGSIGKALQAFCKGFLGVGQ